MTNIAHILVVDDDKRLRELLQQYLIEEGFLVTVAHNAQDVREKLVNLTFDLIVLDIMMPGESGLTLTADLREKGNDVPILLLTARGDAEDRILGLEQGADDYLSKPFEPRELLLRIRKILRWRPQDSSSGLSLSDICFGDFVFDLTRKILKKGEATIKLTTAEIELLSALAISPDTILSREELCQRTGADDSGRSLDIQMMRLRRKIEKDPRTPRHLHTVRGRGYLLRSG